MTRHWTAREDALVLHCWPDWSAAEVAGMLGRTVRSVQQRATQIGATTPRPPRASPDPGAPAARTVARWAKAYRAGKSLREIAASARRDPVTIRKHLLRAGVEMRPKWSPEL